MSFMKNLIYLLFCFTWIMFFKFMKTIVKISSLDSTKNFFWVKNITLAWANKKTFNKKKVTDFQKKYFYNTLYQRAI